MKKKVKRNDLYRQFGDVFGIISGFSLDSDIIAKLIFNLLPDKNQLTLSINRTNWKFGKTDINIFMLGIVY